MKIIAKEHNFYYIVTSLCINVWNRHFFNDRRIRTYLPDKKKLVGPEEPIATIRNREKLCELEEEQTASFLIIKH